jgi:hypothetical protein
VTPPVVGFLCSQCMVTSCDTAPERFLDLWLSLPLLRRLAEMSCHHLATLRVLQVRPSTYGV